MTTETREAIPLERMPRDTLKSRLDVYGETAILRTFENESCTVRVVSADDIATAFTSRLDFGSGLLPREALWWKRQAGGDTLVALWREPQVWNVALQTEMGKPPMRLKLPMPGLVFLCTPGRTPYVFAAKERPRLPTDRLYKAPCFNVFRNGGVCPGSHKFPQNVGEIPESFFMSFFSQTGDHSDRSIGYKNNLRGLWLDLDGSEVYPLDDLVDQFEVKNALAITG